MPDYIYLLENRLSVDQQNAVRQLREAAREAGMLLFLTGDAVRDLTSGHAVRDLEVAVHGNPLKLKKLIEKLNGHVWGEDEDSRSLYLCFPGTVRVDVIGAQRVEFPKPGAPVFHPASIHEYLRCRDFTVNAMAISLNEGSFGLLMDPLNGAADIEARTLRLVSNYGFLEDPSLLIRATRYRARLGWELDPKTQTRFENARAEGVIDYLSAHARSQELEHIGHEDEGLKVLQALDVEGWMKVLFPAWTPAKADEEKLKALHDLAVELQLQGVHADMSAAQMQLLTVKLAPKELTALKKLMLRPGFVEEWNSLDALAAKFAKTLLSKENSTASAGYKLFTSYDPEAILWLGFSSKDQAVQGRFNLFLKVWPEVRQRIPHALMQEMRITPELASYHEIVHSVFLELIDGRLAEPEEMRAFLEPHSPPAPPPQVTIKRPRVKRGAEAKLKEHSYDDEESEEGLDEDEDLDDIDGDEEEIDLGLSIPKIALDADLADEADSDEEEAKPAASDQLPAKRTAKSPAQPKPSRETPVPEPAPVKAAKPASAAQSAKPIVARSEMAAKPKTEPKPAQKVALAKKSASGAAKPAAPSSTAKSKPAPAPSAKKVLPVAVSAKGSKTVKPAVAVKPAAKKAPAKAAVKAPAKVPAKAVTVQAKAAKAKPAPAVISKVSKASKPAKHAEKKHEHKADKKPAHKAGKKR
jgi:tRNA nucleotidyltransferase/poly(A) polymerase